MGTSNKIEVISKLELFKSLGKAQLEAIADIANEKTYLPKESVVNQGEHGDAVYFIKSGSVRVYNINKEGKEINLATLGPSEPIGEMALIDEEPRAANVETLENATLLFITGPKFRELLKNNPDISLQLLKTLSRRIREGDRLLEDTLSIDLKQRTLNILKTLSKYTEGKEINISQEELAGLISATRPRITEALKELGKDGKIKISHRKITLL